MSDLAKIFGDPIATYSMAEALADGVLVDAGDLAGGLFKWPVILTRAVHLDCVAWDDSDTSATGAVGQSETGRLWDVLWMTYVALQQRRADDPDTQSFPVSLYRVARAASWRPEPVPELVRLVVRLAVHDDGRPVLVISQPEES